LVVQAPSHVIYLKDGSLDRFQDYPEFPEPVWNHFKTRLFPFATPVALNIDRLTTEGFLP
jgi:hypothetical protein